MEQIKSAKLNKTLTSQDVTRHLKVLRSSGGAIQPLVAVPWKMEEQGQSLGILQVAGVCSHHEESASRVHFSVALLQADPEQLSGVTSQPRRDLRHVQHPWDSVTGGQDNV